MRADALLSSLAALAPASRDAAVEDHLGLVSVDPASPGTDLIGHHPSGVASVVRMLLEVPVTSDDVVFDLGAGVGKVLLLTRLLTGATARGVELQPALAGLAREAAHRLGVTIEITTADARGADIEAGTVFFLYLPFTGAALATVLERLHAIARHHAIVVCTLGLDLDAPWLVRRESDAFWLAIYDSFVPGVAARPPRAPVFAGAAAEAVAFER